MGRIACRSDQACWFVPEDLNLHQHRFNNLKSCSSQLIKISLYFKRLRLGLILKMVFPRPRCWTVPGARSHPHINLSKIHFNIIPLMLCLGVAEITYSVQWFTTSWTVRGSIPGGPNFPCRPDRPWGSFSLMHIGSGSFPCVKMPERGAGHRVANA